MCHNSPLVKKLVLIIALTILFPIVGWAQYSGHAFRFSANYACAYSPLDSILIENLTQGGTMTLYYPDTVASFVFTGNEAIDPGKRELQVSQNYPNPFSGETNIDVYLPEPDQVLIHVHDLAGRKVTEYVSLMDQGTHQFTFYACAQQAYLLTVSSNKHERRQIMIQVGKGNRSVARIVNNRMTSRLLTTMEVQDMPYNSGDELRFTGFVTDGGGQVAFVMIEETPDASKDYLFDINNEIPEAPTEIYGDTWVHGDAKGVEYEVTTQAGIEYNWEVPEKWSIGEGQGTHRVVVDAGGQSGDITVRARNACGIGLAATLQVKAYYTVTLVADPPGGGTVAPEYAEVEVGHAISLNASPKDAWLFSGWEGGLESLQNPREFSITGNANISAIFEEDMNDWRTYFEEVPDAFPDLTEIYEAFGGGAGSTVVVPADLNKNGRTDLVFHFARGYDRAAWDTLPLDMPVQNTLVALIAQEDGSFADQTEEIFGSPWVDLAGGGSRKVAIADINNDGYPDWVYSLSREDGRPNISYPDGKNSWYSQPVAVLSNGDGTYRTESFGEMNYHHDVAIKKTSKGEFRVVFERAEYTYIGGEFIQTNDLPSPRGLGVVLAYGDGVGGMAEHLLLKIPDETNWWYPKNIVLFRRGNDSKWVQESVYPRDFVEVVDFIAWNGDTGQTNIIQYDNLKFFNGVVHDAQAFSLYPDSAKLPMIYFSGLVVPENWTNTGYVDLGDFPLWNKLIGLRSTDGFLKEMDIFSTPVISSNFNYFEAWDLNNNGYEDIAIYPYERDGPRVHLNDQQGRFNLISQSRFPIVEGSGGWTSLFADIDGDGIPDLIYFPGNGCDAGHGCTTFKLYKGIRFLDFHLPVVQTAKVTNLVSHSAVSGGNVINDGGLDVTDRGLVWSQVEKPTMESNEGILHGGQGKGEYSNTLQNLEIQTRYYVRAFAVNRLGTGYGEQIMLTTPSELPVINSQGVTNITHESAKLTCSINPNDQAVNVYFEYGITTELGQEIVVHEYPLDGSLDVTVTASVFDLESDKLYYYRVRAEGEKGVSFGEIMQFKTLDRSVTDIDGNVYHTVLIGNQEWMAENLRTTRYSNGEPIPTGLSGSDWEATVFGAFSTVNFMHINGLNSEEEAVKAYGLQYNWHTVDSGVLCPVGWHVPSQMEMEQMLNYVQQELIASNSNPELIGNALKSCRQINSPLGGECSNNEHPRWEEHQIHFGRDIFGLGILPTYRRHHPGFYDHLGTTAFIWSVTEYNSESAMMFQIHYDEGTILVWPLWKNSGANVRCIRDKENSLE